MPFLQLVQENIHLIHSSDQNPIKSLVKNYIEMKNRIELPGNASALNSIPSSSSMDLPFLGHPHVKIFKKFMESLNRLLFFLLLNKTKSNKSI
jgi:hypothetical protein